MKVQQARKRNKEGDWRSVPKQLIYILASRVKGMLPNATS